MNIQSLIAATLLISSASTTVRAESNGFPCAQGCKQKTAVSSALKKPPAATSGLVLGATTPSLTLPLANGSSWSSREQLGQHSLVIFVVGQKAPFTPAQFALPAVQESFAQLTKNGILPVMVLSKKGPAVTHPSATSASTIVLNDAAGAACQQFGVQPGMLKLVGVDRAGFVRSVQTLSDPKQMSAFSIGMRLRQVGETLSPPQTPSEAAPLRVGQLAPAFILPDMNGQMRRLSDLKGRQNLLLTFFPKCFTGRCATHLSSLRDAFPALTAQDTQVWAVSVDPAGGERGQRAFAQDLHLPFPMIPDEGRNLSILYGAANSPNQLAARISVLIDKEGRVRWIDKQINPPTHGADVLAKLRELGLTRHEEESTGVVY